MAKFETDDLSDFFSQFDKKTLLPLIPMLAVTFALDQVFSLQPPWPKFSTYVTAFLELCTLFIAFFVPLKSKRGMFRAQLLAFCCVCICFVLYFICYSFFVFDAPFSGERLVAGFVCTPEAENYVAPAFGESCPLLSEAVLSAAQYDPEIVWTPSSVRAMESLMFLLWSGFFVFATFLFGISVAFQNRRKA